MEAIFENHSDIFALCWIAIVVVIWLLIRRYRPEILGIGKNFNDQRIDGVRHRTCPGCNEGLLEPQFYKRKRMIGIPPGFIYVVGHPDEYICSKCKHKIRGSEFGGKFTRISLASPLSKISAAKTILLFIGALIVIFVFSLYIS